MLLDIEQEINREDFLYKTGETNKDKVYDFRKHKIIRSLGLTILNGTTTLESATNDQVYLKDAIDNFKKYSRTRLLEKITEKELALKNTNDLLTRREWIINAFERGMFPMHTRAMHTR